MLVFTLLTILAFFILHGLADIAGRGTDVSARFTPFLTEGVDGLLGTVGLVFVSYVGLTKVASMAEEVQDPDRNIPLGMTLTLLSVTAIYVIGVFVMVAVLGADALSQSLTPVADTAAAFATWLPGQAVKYIVVAAAVVGFASMSNAGIMAASRYPLAMARDRIFPAGFATTGRLGTPLASILLTCSLLVLLLLVLNVEEVAKLASAMQLMLFGLINVAVIVMRESRIEAYDPGFKSPFYPWVQLAGLIIPLVLVAEMGWLPVLFTLGVTTLCFGWYTYYAQPRIAREGAIYHVFERLGRRRFAGLDRELRDLMKEKGLRAEDPFDQVVARAYVMDLSSAELGAVIKGASDLLQRRLPVGAEGLIEAFGRGVRMGGTPVSHGAALLHTRLPEFDRSEVVLVRCRGGLQVDMDDDEMMRRAAESPIRAVFFLVSGEIDPGRHLRILAQLAGRVEDERFMEEWLASSDEQELKETLLRDDRFLSLKLESGGRSEALIGRALNELGLPPGCLVALIRRYGSTIVPRGQTVLREGDRLTIIGEPEGLAEFSERYDAEHHA